jgi:large subunit ribosomal protein L17
MAASLIEHGVIRTTEAKAKELRRFVEKLITTAKRGTLHARRRVFAELCDRAMVDEEGEPVAQTVLQKLFDEIAPRYADRPGGYTRIVRLSERRIGDAGRQVLLQLVEEAPPAAGAPAAPSRRKRRAAKRHAAAESVEAAAAPDAAEEAPPEEAEAAEEGDEPTKDA